MQRHNNTAGQVLVAAIIAGTAGAIAGLMLAPKSGKELRADIKQKSREQKDKAVDTFQTARQNVADTAADVKDRAAKVVRDTADNLRGSAEEVADEGRGVTRRARQRVSSRT